MKIFTFLLVILLTSSIFAQQKYYTFSELKGMEDISGNTQLFYRLYFYQHRNPPMDDYEENSIYHLDTKTNSDSLLLFDGGTLFNGYKSITDYEFWDNNPHKFIYNAVGVTVDPTAFIFRYDSEKQLLDVFGGYDGNLEISKQNDSLIYSSIREILFQSTNGGWTWDTVKTLPINLIALSPRNDKTIFAATNLGELNKSTDGGKTFSVVDTSKSNYSGDNKILFDKDTNYVYRVFYNNNSYSLIVSNNQGNAFSWTKRFSDAHKIFISLDYSQTGTIFLSNRKNIYSSNNYGENFSLYKSLDRDIIGIYKKPNSNILYAATKYDLYEITSDTIKPIKNLSVNPDIFSWFPLKKGNKWVYNSTFTSESEATTTKKYVEVSGSMIYKGKNYFELSGSSFDGNFYRVDSSSEKIYRAYFDSDTLVSESLFLDLTAKVGDTFYVEEHKPVLLENEKSISKWGLNSTQREYKGQSTPLHEFSLIKGIGLNYELWWELVGTEDNLTGAVIDGIVYGDTTVVGIEDEGNNLPTKFSLSQNYPNPFNPTTKIKYTIPLVETRHASSVQLKIYDILGNEIATLVNKEQSPGEYEVEFDAGKYNLSSGIYFYQLKAGSVLFKQIKCYF